MSSVDDLLLWDRNFYHNRLGKGPLIRELETRGVLKNGEKISCAPGLETGTYRGLPTVEHDGALFGYRTVILRFPEQRFTVLAPCNVSSASQTFINDNFPDPGRFAWKYLDLRRQILESFTAAGGNLMYRDITLRRAGANQFKNADIGTVTFDGSRGGMRQE
jgi:hypothetical protein